MPEFILKVVAALLAVFGGKLTGRIKNVTWHWTAGLWWQTTWGAHNPYHFVVKWVNGKAVAVQTRSLMTIGEHVHRRNTGNIGLSLAGMGRDRDGKIHTIQNAQIETFAKLTAELCHLFGLSPYEYNADGSVNEQCRDHAYWATKDGYGPGSGSRHTRVDIAHFEPVVRKKAIWYYEAIKKGQARKAKGEELQDGEHDFEHTKKLY